MEVESSDLIADAAPEGSFWMGESQQRQRPSSNGYTVAATGFGGGTGHRLISLGLRGSAESPIRLFLSLSLSLSLSPEPPQIKIPAQVIEAHAVAAFIK